ncbi:hypothetical protein [Labedaea rhizosphaerae]|uniref:Uncharacterized protein n=1 Tax=Labedaea rhizosphaerae TaxID=598644 RepID=A0A4V3CZ94_LABRH|nr:hypothetical protein [Labedaea rhizosphaerae]TDP97128.1 hypothetical protein EV186_10388 [Labedaea rhizosphaerae]
MPDHELPPDLQDMLHRVDSAFGTLRTELMRAYETPVPEYAGPSPEELSEAAKDPAASKELRAVDALVRAKKLTWDDVLRGRADAVPEVRALQEYGKKRLTKLMADGPQEEPAEEPAPAPHTGGHGGGGHDDEGHDDEGGSVMRDAW